MPEPKEASHPVSSARTKVPTHEIEASHHATVSPHGGQKCGGNTHWIELAV